MLFVLMKSPAMTVAVILVTKAMDMFVAMLTSVLSVRIGAMLMPPAQTHLVDSSVHASVVSLAMASRVLIQMSATTNHAPIMATARIHTDRLSVLELFMSPSLHIISETSIIQTRC